MKTRRIETQTPFHAECVWHEGVVLGDWFCPSCNNHNFASRAECFKCGERKPAEKISRREKKKGDWHCPQCNFMNFAARSECFDCGAERPASDRRFEGEGFETL